MRGEARLVEVFASPRGRDVIERELVLRARGIGSFRSASRGLERLYVDERDAEEALSELGSYERENANWPPTDDLPPMRAGAFGGAATYAVLLALCDLADRAGALGRDWRALGASHAEAIRAGEAWRAVTSLFLHADLTHLLSNLIFGTLFGVLATRPIGGGLGWATILAAGFLGNLTNAWIEPASHVSIGASTAVFAAVGLLGGTEWRRRHIGRQSRLKRLAPVVIALLLFALYGVPHDPGNVDVAAHATGVLWGLALGALVAGPEVRGLASPRGQRVASIAALATVVLAWTLALTSAS